MATIVKSSVSDELRQHLNPIGGDVLHDRFELPGYPEHELAVAADRARFIAGFSRIIKIASMGEIRAALCLRTKVPVKSMAHMNDLVAWGYEIDGFLHQLDLRFNSELHKRAFVVKKLVPIRVDAAIRGYDEKGGQLVSPSFNPCVEEIPGRKLVDAQEVCARYGSDICGFARDNYMLEHAKLKSLGLILAEATYQFGYDTGHTLKMTGHPLTFDTCVLWDQDELDGAKRVGGSPRVLGGRQVFCDRVERELGDGMKLDPCSSEHRGLVNAFPLDITTTEEAITAELKLFERIAGKTLEEFQSDMGMA